MSDGTSWRADRGELARITLALKRGDVRWTSRTAEWLLKHFDRTKYSQKNVVHLMYEHVMAGNPVKGQRNIRGQHFHVWFSINIPIDGVDRFIKFGIEPDEDENPGLVILSTHPPH